MQIVAESEAQEGCENMNLKNTKALVTEILEKDVQARNSDSFLYFKVLHAIGEKINVDVDALPVTAFLLLMDEFGFPPFESVRRSRQKVQAECPWLAACDRVKEFRAENEQDFREFARG